MKNGEEEESEEEESNMVENGVEEGRILGEAESKNVEGSIAGSFHRDFEEGCKWRKLLGRFSVPIQAIASIYGLGKKCQLFP